MKKSCFSFCKCFIIICIIFVATATANAQLRFGIRGGYDVISNSINKNILNTNNRLGFHVGGSVELMSPIIGLGGELSVLYGHEEFNIKGSKIENDNKSYAFSDYNYVRVPLDLKKRFGIGPIGVFIQAGPYVEFKLNGGNISDQYKTKTFGAGLDAGAGVSLLKHIQVGMYYRKLLTENYSQSSGLANLLKKRPDNWSVALTYFF